MVKKIGKHPQIKEMEHLIECRADVIFDNGLFKYIDFANYFSGEDLRLIRRGLCENSYVINGDDIVFFDLVVNAGFIWEVCLPKYYKMTSEEYDYCSERITTCHTEYINGYLIYKFFEYEQQFEIIEEIDNLVKAGFKM